MQRVEYTDTVCVLVRQDGNYRLEQTHYRKTKVFEGSISAAELNNLWIVLNADELRTLSQDKIPTHIVGDSVDVLAIGIARPGHWQNLMFSPEGRKEFRRSVGPLVSWFDEVQKTPHTELSHEHGNNCTPAMEPVVSHASSESAANRQSPIPPPAIAAGIRDFFVLRLIDDNIFSPGRQADRTCVIVYGTGRYRLEKSNQEVHEPAHARVYLGSLSAQQMQNLRGILDAPDLRSLKEGNPPLDTVFSKGERIDLSIPRLDHVQVLTFMIYLGMADYNQDTRYLKVDASRILEPLRKWIGENIEKYKGDPLKESITTQCTPTREEGELKTVN